MRKIFIFVWLLVMTLANAFISSTSYGYLPLNTILSLKYTSRVFLEGGPVRQPNFIRWISTEGQRPDLEPFIHQEEKITIPQLAAAIIGGQMILPLTIKSNMGAFGSQVAFIELEQQKIKITMAINSLRTQGRREFVENLARRNQIESEISADGSTVALYLERSSSIGTKVIISVLDYLIAPAFGGIAEPRLDFLKIDGRAYETRHGFIGNLKSGAVQLDKIRPDGTDGWYARLGSSSYYSNLGGRKDSQLIHSSNMFEPMLHHFKIPQSKWQPFVTYVDQLIEKEFMYLAKRLKQRGFDSEILASGEFDLAWDRDLDHSTGFPRPYLVELTVHKTPEISSKEAWSAADRLCARVLTQK